jgi:hypothetical protein
MSGIGMIEWDFSQWVSYIVLGIAAIITAMDQSIKLAPDLSKRLLWLTNATLWAFSPIAFIIIATIILGLRDLGVINTSKRETAASFIKFPDPYHPISVVGKTFRNERVILDDYSYYNCPFDSVTFVYNGTTVVSLSDSKISGNVRFDSDNASVSVAWVFLEAFKDVMKDAPLKIDLPPGNVFEQIKRGQ